MKIKVGSKFCLKEDDAYKGVVTKLKKNKVVMDIGFRNEFIFTKKEIKKDWSAKCH